MENDDDFHVEALKVCAIPPAVMVKESYNKKSYCTPLFAQDGPAKWVHEGFRVR
jgi:hypothetical protein